jgi:hypothetical protein
MAACNAARPETTPEAFGDSSGGAARLANDSYRSLPYMTAIAKYFGIPSAVLALAVSAAAKDIPQSTTDHQALSPAIAELQSNLDAKTAKVGDVVTAKLTEGVQVAGVELRRNTLLIGHVVEVEPSENNGASKIILTFDKAQPKNGQPIAVKATIVGIFPNGFTVALPDLNPTLKVQQESSDVHGSSLTSDVQSDNSGVLSGKRNVHLPQGTEFQLALASAAVAATTGN